MGSSWAGREGVIEGAGQRLASDPLPIHHGISPD